MPSDRCVLTSCLLITSSPKSLNWTFQPCLWCWCLLYDFSQIIVMWHISLWMQLVLTLHTSPLSKYGHFWLPLQKAGSDIKLSQCFKAVFLNAVGDVTEAMSVFCIMSVVTPLLSVTTLQGEGDNHAVFWKRSGIFHELNPKPPTTPHQPLNNWPLLLFFFRKISVHLYFSNCYLFSICHMSVFPLLTKTIIKALHSRHLSFKSLYLTNETANVTHSMSK